MRCSAPWAPSLDAEREPLGKSYLDAAHFEIKSIDRGKAILQVWFVVLRDQKQKICRFLAPSNLALVFKCGKYFSDDPLISG